MNFLADENVFLPIVESIRQRGHDVFDIKEKLYGMEDSDVFDLSRQTQASSSHDGQRFFKNFKISSWKASGNNSSQTLTDHGRKGY